MAAASSGGILDALLGGQWEAEEALTASAVQEQLHRVDVRREEVLLTLYANIVERWPAAYDEDEQGEPAPPPDAAALESDAVFSGSLSSLGERGLAEEPAMAAILAAAGQHAAVCEQLRQALEAAGSVRVTAELQQRLADFDALAAQGSYTEAAWIVLELQKACQALPPGSDSGPQQEIDARLGPLLQHLQALVYSYVGVEQGTCMPQLLAPSTAAAEAAAEGEEAGAAAAWAAAAAAQAAGDEQQQRQQLEEEEGQGQGGWAGCEGGASAGEQQYSAYATATSAPGSEAVSRSDSISISTAAPGGAPSTAGGDDSSGACGAAGAAGGAAAAAAAAALADVWGALGVLGQLEQALAGLAAFFMEHSVRPILASQADPSLLTDSPAPSVASTTFSRATQGGVGGGGGGGGRGEGRSSVERLLYKALRALVEQVLGSNAEYAEQLGAVLWPQLAAAYIATQLRPLKPQDDSGVEGFSRRSSLGAKLEVKAVKLGLLPAAASAACGGEGPISRYIRLTVGKLLAARRARLVSAARDLFISPAAHETVQVGAPQAASSAAAAGSGGGVRSRQRREQQQQQPNGGLEGDLAVLATAQYSVSQAAEQVVALMREALGEACASGNPAVAQCMCAVVVDVAGLVASLPTAASAAGTAGSEAVGGTAGTAGAAAGAAGGAAAAGGAGAPPGELALPFPAALRHNDCHYVYQALLALPHQFSPRLQRLVHRGVSFSAPAARVRKAGDDCLEGMLQRQEAELQSLVDGLEGFQSLDGPGAIRCRKVMMQLLHSFRRLGSMVRGVLPPAVYIDVAARLVQNVCGRLIGEIMSMPDISVEESEQIPRILEELVTGVYDALLLGGGSAAGAAAAGGSGGGGGRGGKQHGKESGAAAVLAAAALADAMQRQLEEKTPLVMKLRELLELLDIRLAEIRSRWTEGRLPALGFSAGEVSHLVTALFDHSNLRRDFLEQLEAESLM